MSWLWTFLIYGLPWWLQVSILAALVALVFLAAVRVFGWDRVKPFVLPAVALLAALGVVSKAKQGGYQDRRAEEEKALDKAEEIVIDKREDIANDSDEKLDERLDRWTRP